MKNQPKVLSSMTFTELYTMVIPYVRKFEKEIWFSKGLANQVRCRTSSGMKGQAGNLTVFLLTAAGRTTITICDQGEGHWMSMVVAENSHALTMGPHERSIPFNMIREWLSHVTDNWTGVKPDDHVMIDEDGMVTF